MIGRVWKYGSIVFLLLNSSRIIAFDEHVSLPLDAAHSLVIEEALPIDAKIAANPAIDAKLSQEYAEKAAKLSEVAGKPNDLISSLQSMAYMYESENKLNKAISTYRSLLNSFLANGDSAQIAATYGNIASVYAKLSEYDKSVENYLLAMRIYNNIGSANGEALVQIELGLLYLEQEQFEDSRVYFEKALQLFQQAGDLPGVANALNNLGMAYGRMGNETKALEYYFRSLDLFKRSNSLDGYADALVNIGIVNFSRTKYSDAMHEFEEAVRIYTDGGNRTGLCKALTHNAEVNRMVGNIEPALENALKSLDIAIELGNKRFLIDSYEVLAKVYREQGKFREAEEALRNFSEYKSSLFDEERSIRQAEIRERYESEQKEEQIKSLISDQKISELKNKNRQYLYLAGIVVVLLGAFTFLHRYRVNRKANIQLTQLIGELEVSNVHIAEKNKEITDSILYAQRIQQAILPAKESMDAALPEHFVLYTPRDIVSGDFYWMHPYADGRVVISLADCTGHGVPGAFMSMIGNSMLNEIVVEKGITNPAEVLDNMKSGIIKALKQRGQDYEARDGMDMSYMLVNAGERTVEFCGANQNLIYVEGGELKEIKGDKQPIGYMRGFNDPFKSHKITLQENDSVYMLSDGFPDQFGGPRGKKYKYNQFRQMISEIWTKPMKEQQELLSSSFQAWKKGFDQVDDVCVIGLKL